MLTDCCYYCLVAQSCLSLTPWTTACQAPLHGSLRQEYWSGLPFSFLGDLPNPGINPQSPANLLFGSIILFFFLLKSCWALGARFLSCDEIPPYIKHLFGPITSSLCALEARGPHEKNAGVFTALLCGE